MSTTEVIFHSRNFTRELQKVIQIECDKNKYIWRGFENVDLIAREITVGLEKSKKLLPESFHDYIEIKVDPFDFHIDFYISVGHED